MIGYVCCYEEVTLTHKQKITVTLKQR